MKTGWKWAMPAVLMVGAAALAACGSSSSSTSSSAGSTAAAGGGAKTLIVSTDLPLQGASADASADTNNAIQLLLDQAGGKAGNYTIKLLSLIHI